MDGQGILPIPAPASSSPSPKGKKRPHPSNHRLAPSDRSPRARLRLRPRRVPHPSRPPEYSFARWARDARLPHNPRAQEGPMDDQAAATPPSSRASQDAKTSRSMDGLIDRSTRPCDEHCPISGVRPPLLGRSIDWSIRIRQAMGEGLPMLRASPSHPRRMTDRRRPTFGRSFTRPRRHRRSPIQSKAHNDGAVQKGDTSRHRVRVCGWTCQHDRRSETSLWWAPRIRNPLTRIKKVHLLSAPQTASNSSAGWAGGRLNESTRTTAARAHFHVARTTN